LHIRTIHLFCFITILLSCQSETQESTTIPFKLSEHNNIIIEGIFNGQDTADLMFHTAANDISIITEAAENMNTINWGKSEAVKSWGGDGESKMSNNNSLQIGSYQWDSLMVWESTLSAHYTDGKFGPNLFKGKNIEVDFNSKELKIHEFLNPVTEAYQKIPLEFDNGFMFIEGSSLLGKNNLKNKFLIHSGYSGSIMFDDQFANEHKLSEHITIIDEQELKDSQGNILKTKKGKLQQFTLGDIKFDSISVAFFEGAIGRQKMSVLGAELLTQFNFIIDAKREYIYIKPIS